MTALQTLKNKLSSRFARLLLAMIAILLLLGISKFFLIRKAMSQRPIFPPYKVTTAIAEKQRWANEMEVTGSLDATEGAILKIEEPGKVAKIYFKSGQSVRAGELLLQLDVQVESAQLQAAISQLKLAKANFLRAKKLLPANAISKSAYDQNEADYISAESEVRRLKAVINRKSIIAPFSGTTGIRRVNLGDFTTAGQEITPLFKDQTLYLNFNLPENFKNLINNEQKLKFSVDAIDEIFEAQISAIDPQVTPETRSIAVQALVDNSKKLLQAGMYARIVLPVSEPQEQVIIPASAIAYAPYGNSVYVVEKIKEAETNREYLGVSQRFVTTGAARGDTIAVLSGLKAKEEVVTTGLFKLQPNMEVIVDNSVPIGNEVKPTPQDS